MPAPETTTDWITAIATVFAAGGTIGAVWFALWQVRRQDSRRMNVRSYTSVRVGADEEWIDTVVLSATNVGRRGIRIVGALLVFGDRTTFPWDADEGDALPALVEEGVTIKAAWDQARMKLAAEAAKSPIVAGSFFDGVGNVYSAPFPGVTAKRNGWPWKRRTEYVASEPTT